ncbi:polyol/monosaccharide transporter 5 [Actinidia rufa]|uniref:Polyol/monosaccharide transporter 5 n=1 Tax=Actinidia rufa TaxID=165716 RepID=A0A7J0FB10_9ERIC|nr:polyol/monosaccharide transporter 5 [Actinidia rufa]
MADRKEVSGQPNTAVSAFDPPQRPKRNKFAFAYAILASMASILLGYDIGVMSGAGLYIQKDLKISDVKLEVLMGILNIYSLIGTAIAGRTSDWIGRRYTIVVAAAIFFAGALFMGFAPNYAFLMVGRFVAGIGVGFACLIAPVYTAEVSPASSRGFLTSFPEVFINAGWRVMLGIGAVPSVFLAVAVLAMPESPRWLVLQGRLGDAKKVLDKISDSKEEALLRLADIKEAAGILPECNDDIVAVPKRSHGEGVWRDLILHPTPTVRHILIAGIGIHFVQQTSGIDAVVLYSPKIFEKAGITSQSHKLLATVAVGFVKTMFILVATFLLDRIGRRPLLLTSGTSIGVAVNRVMSGTISMTFLSFSKAITIGGVFFFFMGVAIAGWVFFYMLLPETQGKTLEEMQVLFGTFFKWRSTMRELEKNKRVDGNGESNGYTNSISQIQLGPLTAK